MSTLKETTEALFSYDYMDDNSDERILNSNIDLAEELIDDVGWELVYKSWFDYLKENCLTAESAINYAHLFVCYGGTDYPLPNPYEFLAILYSRVDMDDYWDEAGDVFESIAISVLERKGILDISDDPYYRALDDLKLKEEISKLH